MQIIQREQPGDFEDGVGEPLERRPGGIRPAGLLGQVLPRFLERPRGGEDVGIHGQDVGAAGARLEAPRVGQDLGPIRVQFLRGQLERPGRRRAGHEDEPREEPIEHVVDGRGGRQTVPRRRGQFDEIGLLDGIRIGLPPFAGALAGPDVFQAAPIEGADEGLLEAGEVAAAVDLFQEPRGTRRA